MNRRITIAATILLLAANGQRTDARQDEHGSDVAPLITRGAIRLNLGGAQAILAAAREKAEAMGLKVNISVVDDGGHPIAFARMDGARSASSYTSMTKATRRRHPPAADRPRPPRRRRARPPCSTSASNSPPRPPGAR